MVSTRSQVNQRNELIDISRRRPRQNHRMWTIRAYLEYVIKTRSEPLHLFARVLLDELRYLFLHPTSSVLDAPVANI